MVWFSSSTVSSRCRRTLGHAQLEWIADEVLEADGEATVWIGRPGSVAQARQLAQRMASAVAAEYLTVINEADEATTVPGSGNARTVGRLRRELRRIGQRDFFPPPERELARQAVDRLTVGIDSVAR